MCTSGCNSGSFQVLNHPDNFDGHESALEPKAERAQIVNATEAFEALVRRAAGSATAYCVDAEQHDLAARPLAVLSVALGAALLACVGLASALDASGRVPSPGWEDGGAGPAARRARARARARAVAEQPRLARFVGLFSALHNAGPSSGLDAATAVLSPRHHGGLLFVDARY